MSILFEIIRIAKRESEDIDYSKLIFKVKAADVMDLDISSDLWVYFKTMIDGGVKKIIVDLEGLVFIDSFGIGILIKTAKFIRTQKGDIALINLSPRVLKIFEPINFQRFVNMFDTIEDAVDFFRY